MSNVPNVAITYTFNGDTTSQNLVNASQLDTQYGNLATAQNQTKAALDVITDPTNQLTSQAVGFTQLKAEVRNALLGKFGATLGTAAKTAVRLVGLANVAALSGAATLDGTAVANGDYVLLTAQTTTSQNGLWVVNTAGAWTRRSDLPTGAVQGSGWYVLAYSGLTQTGLAWAVYSPGTNIVDTDPMLFLALAQNFAAPITIYTLDTIAQLKGVAAPPFAATYLVRGYYLAGDGGGGTFRWNSADVTADNGGTVIQATGVVTGRWNRLFNGEMNARWFGCKADNATDDFTAAQAAINAAVGVVYFPDGTYNLSATLVVPLNLRVNGNGSLKTVFAPSHAGFCFTAINGSAVVEVYSSLAFSRFAINGKNGIILNQNEVNFASNAPIIKAVFTDLYLLGTYSAANGDAAFETSNLRNNANALDSSLTSTTPSAANTYTDVSAYGIGLSLTKVFDSKIENCSIRSFGVGVAFIGSDINTVDTVRFDINGISVYDRRVGTYGSQNLLNHCDILQNKRVPCILCHGTKFTTLQNNYVETSKASGCYLWIDDTEGFQARGNRFDDCFFYFTTMPFAIVNAPKWNNKLSQNRYQRYATTSPIIRNLGFTNLDSNHTQLAAIEDNGIYFPKWQNFLPGYALGAVAQYSLSPCNILGPDTLGGNIATPVVADGALYVFYDAGGGVLSWSPRLRSMAKRVLSLLINAKATAGVTIFFTITHNAADGTIRSTPVSAAIGGFNTVTYATVTQAVTLTLDPLEGDYLGITWATSSARIAGLEVA